MSERLKTIQRICLEMGDGRETLYPNAKFNIKKAKKNRAKKRRGQNPTQVPQ